MLDDILPVRGVGVSTQVGLKLSRQNLQGRTLADTVGSNQAQHLAGAGHRKTMQLEAVRAIAMCDLALEVRWQVDDGDGVERALLRADTATDAERLGDEGKFGFGSDLDTELATTDDGTRLLAFLTAFSRATLTGEKGQYRRWRGT